MLTVGVLVVKQCVSVVDTVPPTCYAYACMRILTVIG
jgi:hypothetical protein